MTFLYFAYGSNLLRERILVNNPSAVFIAVAKLTSYRLHFCAKEHWGSETRWKGGVASIEEAEGDSVWGVVWQLNKTDLSSLDKQEGVGGGIYRRLDALRVSTAGDQSQLECISYQFVDPFYIRPSPHYLKVIETGAKQQNLPETYRQYLSSIEHNGYQGPLPLFDEIMKKVKL